jgi:hypothetical protein
METEEKWTLPPEELGGQAPLLQSVDALMDTLFLAEVWREIEGVPGIFVELGCRYGKNLVTAAYLRTMLEPLNLTRFICGFDTFEGLLGTCGYDGDHGRAHDGAMSVPDGWDEALRAIMEKVMPTAGESHIVKGDVGVTLPRFLEDNPGLQVALAYFDMDIYRPTLEGLQALEGRMTPGGIIAFDEYACFAWPGETMAIRESWVADHAVHRSRFSKYHAWMRV